MTPAQRTAAIKLGGKQGFSKAERGYAKQTAPTHVVHGVTIALTGDSPAVRRRQRTEHYICVEVAKALLDAGYLLGVNDGEEDTIRHSRDLKAIVNALFTTDEDWLLVYEDADQDDPLNAAAKEDTRPDYWVRFVYGNDGWDVVCDYTTGLDHVIGDGTAVQKLIDRAEEGAL